MECYDRALRIKGQPDPSYHFNRAVALALLGRVPEALEDLKRAASRDQKRLGIRWEDSYPRVTNRGRRRPGRTGRREEPEVTPEQP